LTTNISKAIQKRADDLHEAWILGTSGKDLPVHRELPSSRKASQAERIADYRERIETGAKVRGYTMSESRKDAAARMSHEAAVARMERAREAARTGNALMARRVWHSMTLVERVELRAWALESGFAVQQERPVGKCAARDLAVREARKAARREVYVACEAGDMEAAARWLAKLPPSWRIEVGKKVARRGWRWP
jgi:hypothetical protein